MNKKSNVITLIANPLTSDHIDAVEHFLNQQGIIDIERNWLAPDHAIDLFFDAARVELRDQLRTELSDHMVDFAWQQTNNRRKKLLIADMDSTIITVECIDEMADMLNLKDEVSAITERAMRGELDFVDALKERALMLKGLSLEAMQQVFDERIHLSPGARALVRTMAENGAYTALISGGFDFFTNLVRQATGFHFDHSNHLQTRDDALTGLLEGEIVDANTKLSRLKQFCTDKGLDLSESMAVGDGANDLQMIQAAGLGVAYRAKPVVAAAAAAQINYTDLRSLLYFQGYRASEIIED